MANEIISYLEMCASEGASLQRGMNYRLGADYSVVLMSIRRNAPYADVVEEDGNVIIYEGHDIPRSKDILDPKQVDQPLQLASGKPTQNGLFLAAAHAVKSEGNDPEVVRVYEKVRDGIWTYNGQFRLTGAWKESDGTRQVCKFRLEIDECEFEASSAQTALEHVRVIPTSVKLEVWKRDQGRCVQCGATDNLHFDHIIPYSKGGTSLSPENVQILCAKHNLSKRDKIG